MPAYNEAANIKNVIEQWLPIVEKIGIDSRLVIFDDGSKDETFEITKGISLNNTQLIPIRKGNSGHGSTLMFAYNYAIENGANFIFQTDSDGQTNPEEFWEFWRDRGQFDFQIGVRNNRQDGFDRVIVTLVLKSLILLVFRKHLNDANTPFRLMNANKLKPVLDLIPPNYFLSNVLMSVIIVSRNESISWKPVTFKPRQGGVNSINLKKIFKIGFVSMRDFVTFRKSL